MAVIFQNTGLGNSMCRVNVELIGESEFGYIYIYRKGRRRKGVGVTELGRKGS